MPHVEVGYHLVSDMRRLGYATEAARAVRDCAAANGVEHLVALIRPDPLAADDHLHFCGRCVHVIRQHADFPDLPGYCIQDVLPDLIKLLTCGLLAVFKGGTLDEQRYRWDDEANGYACCVANRIVPTTAYTISSR